MSYATGLFHTDCLGTGRHYTNFTLLNTTSAVKISIRTELSNLVFEELEQVEDYLIEILQKYYADPQLICSLTRFKYIRHQPFNLV